MLIFGAIALNDYSVIRYLPAYFFGPLIGALLAGVFVRFVAIRFLPDQDAPKVKIEERSTISTRKTYSPDAFRIGTITKSENRSLLLE